MKIYWLDLDLWKFTWWQIKWSFDLYFASHSQHPNCVSKLLASSPSTFTIVVIDIFKEVEFFSIDTVRFLKFQNRFLTQKNLMFTERTRAFVFVSCCLSPPEPNSRKKNWELFCNGTFWNKYLPETPKYLPQMCIRLNFNQKKKINMDSQSMIQNLATKSDWNYQEMKCFTISSRDILTYPENKYCMKSWNMISYFFIFH